MRGEQVDVLADLLIARLPEGPPLYPDGELTDEPEAVMVAELVREAALEGVRDELPHSLAVVVDEMTPREDRPEHDPMIDIRVNLFVERPTPEGDRHRQGRCSAQATSVRRPGTRSRRCWAAVYLDLHVKVAKDWQRDPKQLQRLGF